MPNFAYRCLADTRARDDHHIPSRLDASQSGTDGFAQQPLDPVPLNSFSQRSPDNDAEPGLTFDIGSHNQNDQGVSKALPRALYSEVIPTFRQTELAIQRVRSIQSISWRAPSQPR